MRTRGRVRCIAKWTGLVVCVVLVVAWTLSIRRSAAWHNGRGFFLGVAAGQIIAVQQGAGWSRFPNGFFTQTFDGVVIVWLPEYVDGPSLWVLSIPLWIPFAVVAIPTAFLFYRDRRRVKPGHCVKCGYSLTGNVSGRCPECGKPV